MHDPIDLQARVEALEAVTKQHTQTLGALINTVDELRATMDIRLLALEDGQAEMKRQLSLIIELVTSRLPSSLE